MVKIIQLELPISFIRNTPKIIIDLKQSDMSNYDKIITLSLKKKIPSKINEWSYNHVIQSTNRIVLSGLEYTNYILELKSRCEEIEIPYEVSCQNNLWKYTKITSDSQEIKINIEKKNINKTRQFGGGGFGGALLTTGSFTMMAASGGF